MQYFLVQTMTMTICLALLTPDLDAKNLVEQHKEAFTQAGTCRATRAWLQVCATDLQAQRVESWLTEIQSLPVGQEVLERLARSNRQVLLVHDPLVHLSGGITRTSIASLNALNGVGTEAVILFNLNVPDDGSHWATNFKGQPIPFTAVQNFFHELVHAQHAALGTTHKTNIEKQAIETENVFRL